MSYCYTHRKTGCGFAQSATYWMFHNTFYLSELNINLPGMLEKESGETKKRCQEIMDHGSFMQHVTNI